MKTALAITLAIFVAGEAAARDNHVRPHVRRDGTLVEGHMRTNPDRNPYNNFSGQGNYNPYTGTPGRRDPIQTQQQYAPPRPSANPYQNPDPFRR